MTTIAYRDGVLAADTGACAGDSRLGYVQKIARDKRGALAGAAGYATYVSTFLAWFRNGCRGGPPQAEDSDRGVIFHPTGKIVIYEKGGRGSFEMEAAYFAMGSGKPEALGAMFAGADAATAVQAAIEHDAHTYGEVVVLQHKMTKARSRRPRQASHRR